MTFFSVRPHMRKCDHIVKPTEARRYVVYDGFVNDFIILGIGYK